jgi:predicted murein hydrolase (TIGR00659 family)
MPWYTDLLHTPLFAITLTLAAYQFGRMAYRASNQLPLLHPTVSGAIVLAALLGAGDLNYKTYFAGNQLLMFFLGPATVALAIPLYQQQHLIRRMIKPILVTLIAGASFAALSALGIAFVLGANEQTLLSLASKSVTTPIAIGITTEIGGLETLATGAVVFTGALGLVMGPMIFRFLKIDDPRIWGFCMGITAHGVGTARAFELNATAGAFSSLALCLTGTLSAVIIPLAALALKSFS